jgi:hypothetical protein
MKAQADQRLSQQVRQGQQVVEHQLPLLGLINIKKQNDSRHVWIECSA